MIADRNAQQKHVWRCRIVLGTADELGINAIIREGGGGEDGGVVLAGALHG